MKEIFEKLVKRQNLSPSEMQFIMENCMTGQLTDVQIGAFLVLMRTKGETVEELTTAAKLMQSKGRFVNLGTDLIDIVGTGGDGKNTFNVSTISSFVVAAAGLTVAKHGNISVSSNSGSADLLIKAGFELNLNDHQLKKAIKECGIAFLFAPHFHEALRFAKCARQQLGIRTFFNLLGPLLNPARVKKLVIGVYSSLWQQPLAEVLQNLGAERALIIHSHDGLDEISIVQPTDIVEYHEGKISTWTINPKEYHCAHPSLDEVVVGSPAESLVLAHSVFKGEKGPARDMVLLNSAAAIYCGTPHLSFKNALIQAKEAIDSGEALRRFHQLRDLTQESDNE